MASERPENAASAGALDGIDHTIGQSSNSGRSRKRRCFSGCSICRARKVKCDERVSGGCSQCERLGIQCPGNESDARSTGKDLHLALPSSAQRRKTYRSCLPCRTSKTRCSGDRPVCSRCKRKQTECQYDSGPNPAWARAVFQDLPNEEPSAPAEYGPKPGLALNAQPDLVDDPTNNVNYDERPAVPLNTTLSKDSELIAWLFSTKLPERERLFRLIDHYFANIHHLRCMGFIHRPTFMQHLHEGMSSHHSSKALLYAICALGAKSLALEYSTTTRRLASHEVLAAGTQWAKECQRLVFADMDVVSVENLMAAVLLHDHELKVGRFASAFMIAGFSVRMAQALQINVEFSTDVLCTQPSQGPGSPSPAVKEARRRLMWAVYVMDAFIGSGVDQLTLLDESEILVQLPCSDLHFVQQIPVITECLEPQRVLKFVSVNSRDSPFDNMGIAAFYIRLTSYRKRVLRYVKHLDNAQPPWLAESEFSCLDRDLQSWYSSLPQTLQNTKSSMYIRKDSSQLGALFLLHCYFHQTMCDLYRIGMPRLFKIRAKIHYPPERLDFLASVQQTCFYHAQQIAAILQTAIQHGLQMLADAWLGVIAHDTNRVMLYYLTQVLAMSADDNRRIVDDTVPLVRSNLEVLKSMAPLFSMATSLCEASTNMVRQSPLAERILDNLDGGTTSGLNLVDGPTAPGTPVQATPDYVLNPLAIYRLARRAVPEKEKHAPELIPATPMSVEPNTPAVNFAYGYEPQRSASLLSSDRPSYSKLYRTTPIAGSETSDLDMFFSSEFDHVWQPADTILEGSQWGGIAPWESMRTSIDTADLNNLLPDYTWSFEGQ